MSQVVGSTAPPAERVFARIVGRDGRVEPRLRVIDLVDVTKTYFTGAVAVPALRGVTLAVESGEFVAVMGTSGSGKSTLMNLLGLLDRPTTGTYLLRGRPAGSVGERDRARLRREELGFVFQSFNLYPRKTALANVAMPLVFAAVPPRKRRQRARAVLEQIGLGDRVRHRPHELSGGQQQRVAIARAIVNDPALLLADEPTGNLDTATGEAVMQLLRQLNRRGTTIVMVTHDEHVARHARRIVRLSDGLIVSDERVREAERAPR